MLTRVLTLLERVVKTVHCEHRGVKRACEDSPSSHLPPTTTMSSSRVMVRMPGAEVHERAMERGAERKQLAVSPRMGVSMCANGPTRPGTGVNTAGTGVSTGCIDTSWKEVLIRINTS